jgi:hypothetical protein
MKNLSMAGESRSLSETRCCRLGIINASGQFLSSDGDFPSREILNSKDGHVIIC